MRDERERYAIDAVGPVHRAQHVPAPGEHILGEVVRAQIARGPALAIETDAGVNRSADGLVERPSLQQTVDRIVHESLPPEVARVLREVSAWERAAREVRRPFADAFSANNRRAPRRRARAPRRQAWA